MKVEALVKRRLSEKIAVILAEAEEAFNAPHNNVEAKGAFGRTKVVGKFRTREYFVAVIQNRYEATFRKDIENELLGRAPEAGVVFSGLANDETTLFSSGQTTLQYPTVAKSRFAQ